MLERLSKKFAEKLVNKSIASESDSDIYIYGFYQSVMLLLNVVTTLILGTAFKLIVPCIVLNIAYIVIRISAGGHHAESPVKCYINSTIIIAALLAIIKWVSFGPIVLIIVLNIASIIIWITAPVETENNPLDGAEINVYRKRTRVVLSIEIMIFVILLICKLDYYAEIITLGISTECIMLLIGLAKNRYKLSKRT